MGKPRLLIVDDNETVRRVVLEYFKEHGYTIAEARDGIQGLETALKDLADVIILDVNMPGLDGLRVCQFLRQRGKTTPVIMLTDRVDLDDKVAGFEHGADDYLAKPFSPVELELRVKALSRRTAETSQTKAPQKRGHTRALQRGGLKIDIERRTVALNGETVDLTPIEFNILKLLAYSPGQVYSREELLNLIWDTKYDGYKRNIDPHITRLRTKIEKDPRNPEYVQTVWGIGYRFGN